MAEVILAELEAEQQWDERFAASADKLAKLARMTIEREERGETIEKGWDEL